MAFIGVLWVYLAAPVWMAGIGMLVGASPWRMGLIGAFLGWLEALPTLIESKVLR